MSARAHGSCRSAGGVGSRGSLRRLRRVELHPTFAGKAAIYASRLVRNHPLPDGNKRTAYDVMREFIERNGYAFEHAQGGLMETAAMIEKLAAESITEEHFRDWLSERIREPS